MYTLIKSERFHDMNAIVQTVQCGTGMIVKRLVSYTSIVCDICLDTGAIYLYPRHRYSVTTTRQVTRFLSEMLGMHISAGDLNIVTSDGKWVINKGHAWCFREYVLGTENRW
jgi:hypothetical protein